jgi:hypothetical protein
MDRERLEQMASDGDLAAEAELVRVKVRAGELQLLGYSNVTISNEHDSEYIHLLVYEDEEGRQTFTDKTGQLVQLEIGTAMPVMSLEMGDSIERFSQTHHDPGEAYQEEPEPERQAHNPRHARARTLEWLNGRRSRRRRR